ncbi:MAG: hypothetical protein J5818_06055 [Eggerthellaceae bacterium]|nr:hypothetical protein [Eggerthellaceae bacterium]
MLVRPSLVLQIKLKPEDYSEAAAEELKRSYIYLAQSIVSELSEDERADGNVMRLSIRLMRPYWNAADPKAQELWDGVMPQWLRNVTRNMSNAMHNYNEVDHPAGVGPVRYDWVDYEFDHNVLIRVKVDSENRITPEMPTIAEKVRTLLSADVFANGEIDLIRVPSAASYEAQLTAAVEAAQTAQISFEDAEQAEVADDRTMADEVASNKEGGLLEATATMTPEQMIPAFDIDYSIWGIEYTDGTVVEFDSRFDN